jgi:hypothetical protein
MSDLMVLLSTLGGIVLFGALGIIVGPLVGALFITIWDLYGAAFKDILPKPDIIPSIFPGPPGAHNPWRAPWAASDLPGETPFPPSERDSEQEGRLAVPTNVVPRVPSRVEPPRSSPHGGEPDNGSAERDSDESIPPSETTLR